MISSLIKLFDCYLVPLIESGELKGKSETELTPLFEGMFFFSCIWSIGAVCDEEGKAQFNTVFNELLKGDLPEDLKNSLNLSVEIPPLENPYVFHLPKERSVFSYKLTIGTKSEWVSNSMNKMRLINHSFSYVNQFFLDHNKCFYNVL